MVTSDKDFIINQFLNPFVVTDKSGTILQIKSLSPSRTEPKEIQDVFEQWEELVSRKLYQGVIGDKRMLFLKIETDENIIFLGVETNFLFELRTKVSKLETLNRELDAIIENSYDGIYITDANGITLKTNSAIERLTGIPKNYYVGKSVDKLIHRGILKDSVTHRVVKQKRTVSVVQPNFQGKETLITGNPVFNEKGEIEKVVTNIRDLSELNELLTKLTEATALTDKYKKELEQLKKMANQDNDIVLVSEKMNVIYEMADRIANVDATVLILGETGVGKDVLAKYLYTKSYRSKTGDFIKVNCGAIPPELLESELFGYESGAFTGANRKGKQGLFEVADKGVLFLDEIGELPLSLQVKLLRVLQEQEIQRIGGTKLVKVDVKVIAATNRHLQEMVQKGKFREDLYYRLNVIPVTIPALKNRREDIVPLTESFLRKANVRYNMSKQMDNQLKAFFYNYDWPGNIRELSNLIERLVVTTANQSIAINDLPSEYLEKKPPHQTTNLSLKEAVENTERTILEAAVKKYKNTYELAQQLKTSQATVVRKLQKYQLKIE